MCLISGIVYNHWTGLVDWTKIIFMLFNENSPVGLHLETQTLASILSLEASTICTDATWKESYWLLDYVYALVD